MTTTVKDLSQWLHVLAAVPLVRFSHVLVGHDVDRIVFVREPHRPRQGGAVGVWEPGMKNGIDLERWGPWIMWALGFSTAIILLGWR